MRNVNGRITKQMKIENESLSKQNNFGSKCQAFKLRASRVCLIDIQIFPLDDLMLQYC